MLRTPARAIEPGIVASRKRPQGDLVFARQGFPVHAVFPVPATPMGPNGAVDQSGRLADRIVGEIVKHLGSGKGRDRPLAVQVFTPDSDAGGLRIKAAAALQPAIAERLVARSLRISESGTAAHAEAGLIAQICLFADPRGPSGNSLGVAVGVVSATSAPSLFAGGVNRVRRPEGSPSRSAHKLVEALLWLGHGPESGDTCIDLGAAPGGFSQVLADRRCQVTAVDLGRLDPAVAKRVLHVRMNAFHFIPDQPADWVFCDMAYRPLEVAALLARWGRSHWARFLVSNIKLPMKTRVELLDRVRQILESGGWTGVRMRQLYHDRDEVTLFAWRGFGLELHTSKKLAAAAEAERTERTDQPDRNKRNNRNDRPERGAARSAQSSRSDRPARTERKPERRSDRPERKLERKLERKPERRSDRPERKPERKPERRSDRPERRPAKAGRAAASAGPERRPSRQTPHAPTRPPKNSPKSPSARPRKPPR